MKLNERDLHIIDHALKVQYKKVNKQAKEERSVFGKGFAHDELETYMTDLLVRINEELLKPGNQKAFNERMERIQN